LISAIDLSYSYAPGMPTLSRVAFTLRAGERVVLLGANGAGKSTLLSLCNGLLRPCGGELRLFGEPVDYSKAGLRRLRSHVSTVLQDAGDQLFGATVWQDVAMGPVESGLPEAEARQLAMETLDTLGGGHLASRPIHALSAGEKKRVALAGVLTVRPSLLLLDEPTAGLDAPGEDALLETLSACTDRGMAVCIATHDTWLLHHWATRAVVLREGRLAFDGESAEILRHWDRHTAGCGLRAPAVAEGAILCR